MQYGRFFKRFGAWVLDMVITGILAAILGMAVLSLVALTLALDGGLFQLIAKYLAWVTLVVMLALHFLYYGYFWSRDGNTLGMKAFEVKVVRRNPDAQISFLRGGLRGTIGYWISGIVFGLGYLWAAFDRRKETWHDKLFDTAVVREFPIDSND
jgi:uncharacterized RDD family membrane protein YckC